jgi:hypothetical protein
MILLVMYVTCRSRRALFRADDVPALTTELAEIEQRLQAFARRVQAANVARPGSNGFYSSVGLSMIGAPDGWFRRVKTLLEDESLRLAATMETVVRP